MIPSSSYEWVSGAIPNPACHLTGWEGGGWGEIIPDLLEIGRESLFRKGLCSQMEGVSPKPWVSPRETECDWGDTSGLPSEGLRQGVGEPAPDLMRPPQAADEQGRRGGRRIGCFTLCPSRCEEAAQCWPQNRSWQGTGRGQVTPR